MTAVYKRELRSYLTSMVGYLFIFFILLLTGIYFSAYQLGAAYPKFEYTLSALTFVFLISVPILTMRVLAEERKQKTDQLLDSAGFRWTDCFWQISCTGNNLCDSDAYYVFLPTVDVKIRNCIFCRSIHRYSGIFPSGLCKPCTWCVCIFSD